MTSLQLAVPAPASGRQRQPRHPSNLGPPALLAGALACIGAVLHGQPPVLGLLLCGLGIAHLHVGDS